MKTLSIEEKAQAYDEAFERAKEEWSNNLDSAYKNYREHLEIIFPELKESEDEKIRKAIIDYFRWNTDSQLLNEFTNREVFDWLEKQDNTDKTSYEIAEKEKDNYVSGQFLYCKGSFNEFKEGESYWLEYVGNDNYIGRSDNILNQKFHITPRQLYTWLDPRHDPRYCENNNDENNAPTEYGKYVDECLYDAARQIFRFFPELKESEDERIRKWLIAQLQIKIGDNATLNNMIYKTIAWLEKQGNEPNWCHHKVDLSDCSEEYRKAYYDGWNNCNIQHSRCRSELDDVVKCLINGMKFYYEDNKDATWGTDKWSMPVKHIIDVLEKQGEQKPQGKSAVEAAKEEKVDNQNCVNPIDKVKPKFNVGDWVILSTSSGEKVVQIDSIEYFKSGEPRYITSEGRWFGNGTKAHLWTIQDAKDGDVLCYKDEISLYKHDIKNCTKQETTFGGFVYYCCYDGKRFITDSLYSLTEQDKMDIHPATKEQRDLLFSKMKEVGYEWDAEEKELRIIDWSKHIKYKPNGSSIFEHKPAAWSEEDEIIVLSIEQVMNCAFLLNIAPEKINKVRNWLKSLKQRIEG